MKKIFIIIIALCLFMACEDKSKKEAEAIDPVILEGQGTDIEVVRKLIVKEKLMSANEYLIICRGYPKAGLTNQMQINATAQEAALLNAQFYAKQKFRGVDPVRKGSVVKFEYDDRSAIVHYLITYPNIKKMMNE